MTPPGNESTAESTGLAYFRPFGDVLDLAITAIFQVKEEVVIGNRGWPPLSVSKRLAVSV